MKNKKKRFGIILFAMAVMLLLPAAVFGEAYSDGGITYELNADDKSAVVKKVDDAEVIHIPTETTSGNETFVVTGIMHDALQDCSSLTDLIFAHESAPEIQSSENVPLALPNEKAMIYIKQKAAGYTADKLWPEDRVQCYKITRQPIDINIPEGWADLGESHQIAVEAEYPAGGGSILYQWYSCSGPDKSGIQLAKGDSTFDYYPIPKELTAGTYYFFCRIGAEGEKQLDSRIASVTVHPTTNITDPVVASPNSVTARLAKGDYDGIYASWSAVKVAGADVKYKVQYKYGNGSWKTAVKGTSKTSYTIKGLSDGKKVTVRITPYVSVNGKTYSGKAKTSSGVYTLKKLNKPTVKKASKTKVKVRWNNINGETGYEIYKSTKKTKGFKLVKTVKSSKAKSTTFKTAKNKKYYYKVRAYKNIKISGKTYKVYGPWSSVKAYKLK